jgi:hypothetical protein
MRLENLNVPLVKLPSDTELILFIIKEDLKNTKLFNALESAGLTDCFYRADFAALVLGYMGFDDIPDDLQEFYADLISKYAEKIEPDNRVIIEYAFEVYSEILIEKKKRFGEVE